MDVTTFPETLAEARAMKRSVHYGQWRISVVPYKIITLGQRFNSRTHRPTETAEVQCLDGSVAHLPLTIVRRHRLMTRAEGLDMIISK